MGLWKRSASQWPKTNHALAKLLSHLNFEGAFSNGDLRLMICKEYCIPQ
jgi:hypothetical protein